MAISQLTGRVEKPIAYLYLTQLSVVNLSMLFLKVVKNKYFLSSIALLVWIAFFDKNDVFSQYELIQKCKKLEKEKEYYMSEIESNRKNLQELKTNKKSLETFAREQYLMKKENEDVFVFVSK